MNTDPGFHRDFGAAFADEPPLAVSSEQVRIAARKVRSRRRIAGAVAVVAAVAAVTSIAFALPLGSGSGSVVADRPARGAFAPDELVKAIDEGLLSVGAQVRTAKEPVIVAQDDQSNVITGADRDKATLWYGTRELSETNVFEIRLAPTEQLSAEQYTRTCADEVAGGINLTCEVVAEEGVVKQTYTRAVQRQDGAWAVIFNPEQAKVDVWYQRSVRVIHDNGMVVSAHEFVLGTNSPESAEWTASVADLTQIATDPDLTYPPPADDADEPGCGWVVPEADPSHTCG